MHIRVLLFLLAVPFLLAATFWQLDVKTDISSFFVSGKSAQMKLLAGQMQTGEISRRYLVSIRQHKSNEQSQDFIDTLQSSWLQLEGVSRVWGEEVGEDEIRALISFYLPYRYQTFSLEPEKDIPYAFSETGMIERAKAIKQGLLGLQAEWVGEIISQDPMFFMSHAFGNVAGSMNKHTKASLYHTLVVETRASGLDTDSQLAIKQGLEQVFQRVNTDYGSAYKLEMTGVPVFALAIKKQVEEDVKWISSLSTTLMVLLFLVIFRSFQSLVTVMLVLLVSAAMAALLTSLFFGHIYALTLALGTTLIGICVDYPIHTMVHAQASSDKPEKTAKQIWPSLLLGAITTIVGYAALSFTGLPGMQQIALYSTVGILTSLCISRFILPFSIVHKQASLQPAVRLDGWLHMVQDRNFKVPVLMLAALFLGVGLLNIHWEDDLSQLSPSMTALKAKDQEIRTRMQSIEPGRFILIHADNLEKALQLSEKASLQLEALKKEGKLESFYGLHPWLSSHQLQVKNRQLAELYLNDTTQQRWDTILEQQGLRSDSFARAKVPDVKDLDLASVQQSPAARYIAGQYMKGDGQVILTIWLGLHEPLALEKAFSGNTHVEYVSQKDMMNDMNAAYRSKALVALAYGALFIVLLLTLRYVSLKASLQVLLPAIVSVAFMLGFWGLSGYALSILHLLGLLLVVAISVDYGIFFYENRTGDMKLTYQAIVISALTTMIAFMSLALAENPALQVLAWTIAPGVLLGFLLCPLFIQKAVRG